MRPVLENLKGWAQEVFLVDSYSSDETIDVALEYGVHIVQRAFTGFGDQWNFAVRELPVTAPWTMKLDPDERLSSDLKREIVEVIAGGKVDAIRIRRRLWFMSKPLPIVQQLDRLWRTGECTFSPVLVNEHPIVQGTVKVVGGYLEHLDSPDLAHWFDKQNRYTTSEAASAFSQMPLAANADPFGNALERRMWLKKNFPKVPFRFSLLYLYNFLVLGAWRAGRVGHIWSRLRSDVMRYREYKLEEYRILRRMPERVVPPRGEADLRVLQE